MAKYVEHLLTTNAFLEPTTISDSRALGIMVLRLLLFEPGTDSERPEMGVGLGPRYRFIMKDKIPELKTRIEDQCNTYLPEDISSECIVTLDLNEQNYLIIKVVIGENEFIYNTEDSKTPIQLSDV